MENVFHLIANIDIGGSERIAANIVKAPNSRYHFHMIEVARRDSAFTDDFVKELEEYGILCHRSFVVSNKLAIILFPIRMLKLLLVYKPRIIHSHTETPNLALWISYLLWWPLMRNIKVYRTIHSTQLWNGWKWIGNIIEPYFFIKKNANISIGESTQQSYFQCYGVKPDIIYNGIEEIKQSRFEKIEHGKINILFAGRMQPEKGIDTLVKVIDRFKGDDNLFFHIVGEGPEESKVKSQLEGFANVRIYPKIYMLSRYLASFDYIFMPSEFEGLATLSIEASFSRTPVIINACLGLEETLPIDWKYKVCNNDIEAYVAIFEGLLKDEDRNYWGEIAYNYVKERFTIEKMQEAYLTKYNSCL